MLDGRRRIISHETNNSQKDKNFRSIGEEGCPPTGGPAKERFSDFLNVFCFLK